MGATSPPIAFAERSCGRGATSLAWWRLAASRRKSPADGWQADRWHGQNAMSTVACMNDAARAETWRRLAAAGRRSGSASARRERILRPLRLARVGPGVDEAL